MERDTSEKPTPGPNSRAAGQSTLPRFTSPLIINSASRRRSLFSLPRPKEGSARPTSSGSLPDSKPGSQSNTRIPRPSSRSGQFQFSISEAYRLAEEEEAAQGSPSPAPRSWRRRESIEKRASKLARPGVSGKSPTPTRDDDPDNRSLRSQQSDASDSTFDEKLRQHGRDHPQLEESAPRGNGIFSGSKFGSRIAEAGRGLVRRTSRGSIDGSPSPRVTKGTTNSPSLLRRFSGRMYGSQSGAKPLDQPLELGPNAFPGDAQTPERSFAWQVDADFTAGDLHASDSPPMMGGRSNTKIDQIRALEAEVNERFPDSIPESNQDRPRNTRIDDIRALESEAALKFSEEPFELDEIDHGAQENRGEGEDRPPSRRSTSRTNTRLEELRSREIESLSRRALATTRLDEFRGRNISTSRSPSPDIARRPSREALRASSLLEERLERLRGKANNKLGSGLDVPNSTISQNTLRDRANLPPTAAQAGDTKGTAETSTFQARPNPKEEQVDAPQQLLVGVGGIAAPEPQPITDNQRPSALARHIRDGSDGTRHRRLPSAKSDGRPTVGFAGLPRSSSVESRLTKRGSFVHSDSDPTERIEGEMKLFAPLDNQSERGSLRAPSPEPEVEAPDETPKVSRVDPLTQPTPRVTGAFVETPATVKVEKPKDLAAQPTEDQASTRPTSSLRTDGDARPRASLPQAEEDGVAARKHKRAQSAGGDRAAGHSSSLPARRRARSLSRSRRPLTNSAKPPTVKEDLLAIQRANQIEDSTLDDLADYLNENHLEATLKSRSIKIEETADDKLDMEKELEAYDRMSRSLKTGLLGIRSAKQGIQRLEDQVSHADIKDHHPPHTHTPHPTSKPSPSCPACQASHPSATDAGSTTYIHLPLPRLWHRHPKFRFTLLGLTLFLLSAWYLAESAMCYRFCKPEYCYPGVPCEWSPDDPAWGYAIPIKLDQWITGGEGRELKRRVGPEVRDWLADVWDDVTGTDIRSVDTEGYSWEQKRQWRRRMAKKGLTRKFIVRSEDREIFNERKAAREKQERAEAEEEMGYRVTEEVVGDEEDF